MEDLATFTIIPRFGELPSAVEQLERLALKATDVSIRQTEHLATIIGRISPRAAHELSSLRNHVDVLVVKHIEQIATDMQHVDSPLGRIYSPTLWPHEGKMSSASDATYLGYIERPNGTTYLLQYLKEGGFTSHHYHKKTTEFFLSLLGRTLLHCRELIGRNETAEQIAKDVFQRVLPQTAHMLATGESAGLNLLCMEPYDPKLVDHFYVTEENNLRERLRAKAMNLEY